MSKNKKIILTIALLIIVALSFLLFFGIGENKKSDIQIASFIFIVLDELITYGIILGTTNKKNNAFSISGLVSITVIYLIISLIFNGLLIGIFNSLRNILVFNFSAILIYALIIAVIFLAKKEEHYEQ